MLRNLLLSCVVAAGCVVCLGVAPPAAAGAEPVKFQYQVLVQAESGWQHRGTYPLQSEAREVARRLWEDGHRVMIQKVATSRDK